MSHHPMHCLEPRGGLARVFLSQHRGWLIVLELCAHNGEPLTQRAYPGCRRGEDAPQWEGRDQYPVQPGGQSW